MIRYISSCLILILCTSQQARLVKTRINEHLTLHIPADFIQIPGNEISSRYISYRSPVAYFTNPAGDVEFSVNNSASRWGNTDLSMLQELYKSNISNLFDEVTFIRQGIETANKKDYIVFEFHATLLPGESLIGKDTPVRKYYLLYYTIQNGLVLVFSFSAPENQQPVWQETANDIMQSIKLRF